ncbi:MAG: PASTA domain-containing protein, partial [Acidobacteria bacterium]|nr:PASTA domain-containing protein [Acidobacteriota bacterium]
MAEQVGRVLGDRYRVVAPIGAGSSAQVFLADDITLRRRVAVKVLHDALADDEVFLRRFRAEAQAAAALNHPHIMAVYDWGYDGRPFIVSEYLAGGSLRSMLDDHDRLTSSQALLVGLEAARGLEYAHKRGLVHRDIKPGNLLFDEEGRLRIADFGLARALAEAAWTEPTGAVVGTARYASPEQARGQTVDQRSDVYALALVLCEVVSGEVPFSSDTTIGTLMARVDQPIDPPAELGVLAGIVARAGSLDVADRPDAGEFVLSLMASAESLPRPEQLLLPGAVLAVDGVKVDPDPTMLASGSTTKPAASASAPANDAQSKSEPVVIDPGEELGAQRRWPWVMLGLLALLAGAGFIGYQVLVGGEVNHDIPELRGEPKDEAVSMLNELGFEIVPQDGRDDEIAAGNVIGTEPAAGESLEEGSEVVLITSLGPTTVPRPDDLIGETVEVARSELISRGLVPGAETGRNDETIEAGLVIAIDLPDTTVDVPKGTTVDMVVSTGPALRVIPDDLVGQEYAEVEEILKGMGLEIEQSTAFDNEIEKGLVAGTEPGASEEIKRGDTVTVILSDGPEPVTIPPEIINVSFDEAEEILQNLGFRVSLSSGTTDQPVCGSNPSAGQALQPGS